MNLISPDGKKAAFIRDWNLWMRDIASGKETQLTTDGVENFGYATDNAGWTHSDRAILVMVARFEKNRHVSTRPAQCQRYVSRFDQTRCAETRNVEISAARRQGHHQNSPRHHRNGHAESDSVEDAARRSPPTLCDDISCSGAFDDNEWNADASKLAFVSSSRDHKQANLRIADAATGEVKDIHEEKVATQYESGQGAVNWRYLPKSNEFIWYSEKDDWGHLYLYNLDGTLKNQITKGNFVVTRLLKVDEQNRRLYFEAGGRETGRDPYFSHFYRVDFDGKNLTLLTPDDGNHQISLSPDGKYFIDTFSKPDMPPTVVLRDMTGRSIATIEKADVSRLTATGWKPPMPITVKDRNNKWDLYGLMFTPTTLDKTKKYPVVNYIYPGPQGGGVGNRSFAASRSDHQALAELGFIVVIIDGSCNPDRSKSFHDACYGNMADNTLEDQIAGLKQLAAKYPFLDLNRVGVWGHSGGGFATAAAMFRFPDFYKVGISESGNHDNRNYEDDWGERYIGLLSGDNYEKQANQLYAKNLKGKVIAGARRDGR